MYSIKKVYALSNNLTSQWEELEAAETELFLLFSNYRELIVVLTDSRREGDFIVNMNQFLEAHQHYSNTLKVFIMARGEDYNYVFMDTLPNMKVGYVKYRHAAAAGYSINYGKIGSVLPEGYPVSDKPDLALTRDDTDLKKASEYFLFSVNGLLHRPDYDGNALYVADGGVSARMADNNQVGIYSFIDVCKPKIIQITDDMISIPTGHQTLQDRIALKLPDGVPCKSFLLSIGGYMVLPHEQSARQSGDGTILLDIKRLNWLDRYLESRKLIDLTSLELTPSSVNPSAVDVNELYSDRVIRNLLKLSQSFIVVLDVDNLVIGRKYLRQQQAPGYFTTNHMPDLPVLVEPGRLAEYWRIKEGDRWSVTMTDSFRRCYQHRMEVRKRLKEVDGALAFDMSYFFSQAYMLELGAYQNQQ